MHTRRDLFWTALFAFAGGFTAGLLCAPHSGRKSREIIAGRVRAEGRRIEQQLRAMEEQLAALEAQVAAAGREVGEKVREAAERVVDQVTPTLAEDPEAWKVEDEELTRDLRRMPRR
ncbi:YtxH domain-containing protein [Rhodocaloribacter sp.]